MRRSLRGAIPTLDSCAEFLRLRDAGELCCAKLVFSDESYFSTNPAFRNAQTRRAHVRPEDDPQAAAESLHTQKVQRSPGIMVFGAISAANGGFATRAHFAPQKKMADAEYYQRLLENEVFPQCRQAIPGFAWTQDGAPARRAKLTVAWLAGTPGRAERGKFLNIWPPCSPGLNPCDIWLWRHIKEELHSSGIYEHDAAPKLQIAILKIWADLEPAAIAAARNTLGARQVGRGQRREVYRW